MAERIDNVLNYDGLLEAEKITGMSYKEDEETLNLGMALMMMNNERKNEALKQEDDTHFGMNIPQALKIFADLGFAVVHEHTFAGSSQNRIENFYVLFSAQHGVLGTLESYGDRVNSSKIYYNWCYESDEAWSKCISSGHSVETAQGDVLIGSHDVREGLRHIFNLLLTNGNFLPVWVDSPFLWLLDYSQSKGEYDYGKINAQVISTLPSHVCTAINL